MLQSISNKSEFEFLCLVWSRLHSFSLASASILAKAHLGQREMEEQILEQSREGNAELAIVCVVDFEGWAFPATKQKRPPWLKCIWQKTLKKNRSLTSRFLLTETRQRLQNCITYCNFSGYRKSHFRRNGLNVEWSWWVALDNSLSPISWEVVY